MLNMINQYASICILNKKDVPLQEKKKTEAIMVDTKNNNNNNGCDYVAQK